MARLLIVSADDFGLTPGVCEGILAAASDGIVTATSALVVAPAWSRYAAALADSGLSVGAHLCVVGEDPPLLSAAEVPTLVDRSGRFPDSWRRFVARAAIGRIDPDDLRRELSAQLDALADAGVDVTHVNSHQHLHLWPQVSSVVLGLAAERGIAAVRRIRSERWGPGALGVRALGGSFDRSAQRSGIRTTDACAGLDEAGALTGPVLRDTILRLGAGDATSAELVTHPGAADDPDRGRYRWGYRWADELAALTSPDARRAVELAGFELGTFADLVAPS